jgi:hypothetical protein
MTEKKVTKPKARSTKSVVVFHRGGRMEDEDFYRAMAVDENTPLFRGVLELLDRAEDDIWDRNRDAELSREGRADLGLQAGIIREIREQLEAVRVSGLKGLGA